MTEQEVFILADQALNAVVDQIRDDQWDLVVPDDMTRTPGITLRQTINYHAYDDAWVPHVLAGETMEEVGDRYDGDLLGDHPKLNFASIAETAVLAVRDFDDPDRIVHLSYGDWPAREYLKHITSFRGLRARTTSRSSSVRTRPCRRTWSGACGTRSRPAPRSGASSASTVRRCRCRTTPRCSRGCSGSRAGSPPEPSGRGSRSRPSSLTGRSPPLYTAALATVGLLARHGRNSCASSYIHRGRKTWTRPQEGSLSRSSRSSC